MGKISCTKCGTTPTVIVEKAVLCDQGPLFCKFTMRPLCLSCLTESVQSLENTNEGKE